MKWYKKPTDDDAGSGTPADYNTVVLRLDVECKWQDGGLQRAVAGETDPDKLYVGHNVYAKDIVFEPHGRQNDVFAHSEGQEIRSTNTSIIQDEVLAHRLGLIPLCGDREGLRWMKWYKKPTDDDAGSGTPADYNTVVLRLDVECKWQDGGLQRAVAGETDPDKLYVGHNVYAKDIVFEPHGRQNDVFAHSEGKEIRSTNPDILIAKMRPGQSIALSMHAIKGIGQDHAKFSPVATASYRLMPTIDITKPIIGADAKKFARCFPRGVIKLDKVTSEDTQKHAELEGKEGEPKAVVENAMNDTVSRECLRHPEFKDKVKLGRIRDHFIFKVESTGQWESDELFLESVKLLKIKCQRIKRGLDEMQK